MPYNDEDDDDDDESLFVDCSNNELPLFRNNITVYLGAWLNLMFVTLASVSSSLAP